MGDLMTIIFFVFVAVLFMLLCRSVVIWWTGINEVIDELKQIKTILEREK
jgi:hypothetical protein